MALFCPDAVAWGDAATWVTALAALGIGVAGYCLSRRVAQAGEKRSRREERSARAKARAALKHCWIWLAQAKHAATKSGSWAGNSDLCSSIIASMNVDALDRAADAAKVLDGRECEAIEEAAVAAGAAQRMIGELALGTHSPYEHQAAIDQQIDPVYRALRIMHPNETDPSLLNALYRVQNFAVILQSANGATWRRGLGFVPPDAGD